MATGRGALSTDARVSEALAARGTKGNAVDTAIAGVFAYAAVRPEVLLGSVQVLLGGPGAGLYAFDGRVVQPGLGGKRPRGFLPGDAIPAAALVAAPRLTATLIAVLSLYGTQTANQVIAPAVELAQGFSEERARTLGVVARRGATAVASAEIAGPLLERFGPMAQGLLTQDDLTASAPSGQAVDLQTWGELEIARSPFDAGAPSGPMGVVMAVDAYGLFCAISMPLREGELVGELGVAASLAAAPVRRGETRVSPGVAREGAAPIALVGKRGRWDSALAAHGAVQPLAHAYAEARSAALPFEAALERAFGASGLDAAHGLFASGDMRNLRRGDV